MAKMSKISFYNNTIRGAKNCYHTVLVIILSKSHTDPRLMQRHYYLQIDT